MLFRLTPALILAVMAAGTPAAQAGTPYAECAEAAAEKRGTTVSAVTEGHVVSWSGSLLASRITATMQVDGASLACRFAPGGTPEVMTLPSATPDLADEAQKAACIAAFAARRAVPADQVAVEWSVQWNDGTAWLHLVAAGTWPFDCEIDPEASAPVIREQTR